MAQHRAAALPLPLPQRLQLPLLDPEDRQQSAGDEAGDGSSPLLTDWRRRRLLAGAGAAQATPHGAGRTG